VLHIRGRFKALAIGASLLVTGVHAASAQTPAKLREPLPLEVAASIREHNTRSPINYSPDGEWIAHTIATGETIPRDSLSDQFAATGFSFAEGDSRMEATLTNTRTGEVIRLGSSASASWAPTWSPDGQRVAFYSDEGGEAGVWIWEKSTRTARRFPGVIVRPYFGFERPQWSRDGQKLLVKIILEGKTLTEANALGGKRSGQSGFPDVGPDEPSVIVQRAGFKADPPADGKETTSDLARAIMVSISADLALLDLRTQQFTRIARNAPISTYVFSPDEKQVIYSMRAGIEPNAQQNLYDLMIVDVSSGTTRKVAGDIRGRYGNEWSLSPDGRTIAYIESGQAAKGGVFVIDVATGEQRAMVGEGAPNFDELGEDAPLWDASDKYVYAIDPHVGNFWRFDLASGRGSVLAAIPGWKMVSIVSPYGQSTMWTTDRGRTAWVTAREQAGREAGIYAVDLRSGKVRAALREEKTYSEIFSLTASEATGQIAFVSASQQHMHDIWTFDTKRGKPQQLTHINPEMERYELGSARQIEWKGRDGETLRGALLLPPGYREGERLPLVVWLYGGDDGSRFVNRFGFWGGTTFNMHVLATRGYAVLYPDVPVRTGQTMKDIYEGTMLAVDAAVAQGYADPDRLAIMGQSYGSYSVLSVITQTPRFKAAVITAAVLHPDLFADYLGLGKIAYYETGQGNMRGNIWEHADRYRENSPLFLFDHIETPVLIGQGERDGPDLTPSEAIYRALERLGKPVEYRVYEGEGHVITQKPNVLDFWKRRLDFLAKQLGRER